MAKRCTQASDNAPLLNRVQPVLGLIVNAVKH